MTNRSQKSSEQKFAGAFFRIFRAANRVSKQLVLEHVPRKDGRLRDLLGFALDYQTTSEYPFVFSYSFCRAERDVDEVTRIAAAIHLLQTSSLITDDVFDFSDERHHQPTIHQKYDVSHSIVAAELLQTIAMECISSELQRPRFHNPVLVLRLFHQIMKDGYLGQYLDILNTSNLHMTVREYRRVTELGAGYFFQNMARCGALLANKPKAHVDALATYGYHYGMGLWISDDIVDIAEDTAVTGKMLAPDLQGRRMRLPMILALQMSDRKDVRWLKEFLRTNGNSTSVLVEAADRIKKTGALGVCQAVANNYFSRAIESLAGMKGSPTAWALTRLPQRLIKPLEPGRPDLQIPIPPEFRSPR